MTLPGPAELGRRLLGRVPDTIEPMITWDHRSTFRCAIGNDEFVVKADTDATEHENEVSGHRRAAAGGIPVPELIAVAPGALAMRWVPGVALRSDASADAWRAAGEITRRIHDFPPDGRIGGGFMPARDTWTDAVCAEVDEELALCIRDHGLSSSAATRVREAVADAALKNAPLVWCHGDLQPDHLILDSATDRVAAVIDWSDHGTGDGAWDIAVLTLDDDARLGDFLAGYGPAGGLVHLYRAVRLLGEVTWLQGHMPDAVPPVLSQLEAWRPAGE
jgi:aminoglycoside phosphotransferase (APT) family kinase protein